MDAAFMLVAETRAVKILPLRIDDVKAPPLIAALRYADFRPSFDQGLRELIDALSGPVE
jgi:hypothetical protein